GRRSAHACSLGGHRTLTLRSKRHCGAPGARPRRARGRDSPKMPASRQARSSFVSATPSAQYRLTIRVRIDDGPGMLALLTGAIGDAGGIVGASDLVEVDGSPRPRDIVAAARGK